MNDGWDITLHSSRRSQPVPFAKWQEEIAGLGPVADSTFDPHAIGAVAVRCACGWQRAIHRQHERTTAAPEVKCQRCGARMNEAMIKAETEAFKDAPTP